MARKAKKPDPGLQVILNMIDQVIAALMDLSKEMEETNQLQPAIDKKHLFGTAQGTLDRLGRVIYQGEPLRAGDLPAKEKSKS